MSITCTHQPIQRSQSEFQQTDYQVMGLAFDLHNEKGNLWEERDYRHGIAEQCLQIGMEVFEEVQISVSHNGFCKTYFIDLLIDGNIYELKTVPAITEQHEAQTLNYLFLSNTRHGKILNFGQDSLTWRFVSTSLNRSDRLTFSFDTSCWNPTEKNHKAIPLLTTELLKEWGAFLSVSLYKEALAHFLSVHLEGKNQRFISLSPNTVLYLSGLTCSKTNLRTNLQKYLNNSSFRELLWINFNRNRIEFFTLNDSAEK